MKFKHQCCLFLVLTYSAGGYAGEISIGWVDRTPSPPSAEQIAKNNKISEKLQEMGNHREKEARSFIEMQEAANLAKGEFSNSNKNTVFSGNNEQGNCKFSHDATVIKQHQIKALNSRDQVEKTLKSYMTMQCAQSGSPIVSSMSCTPYAEYRNKPLFNNGKMTLTKEKVGDGWVCKASYQCSQPKKDCTTSAAPARATRQ